METFCIDILQLKILTLMIIIAARTCISEIAVEGRWADKSPGEEVRNGLF